MNSWFHSSPGSAELCFLITALDVTSYSDAAFAKIVDDRNNPPLLSLFGPIAMS